MKFEKFKEKVEEIVAYSHNSLQYRKMMKSDYGSGWEPYSDYFGKKKPFEEKLYVETYMGGYSGGNCWDDTQPRYESSGEKREELKLLDEILEKIKPDIGFLQYKNLCNSVIQTGERHVNEYYGNSSEYSYDMIDLQDLYDYMNKQGWLDEDGD